MANDTDVKKQVYDKMIRAEIANIALEFSMKRDILYTKEEVCAQESIRTKDGVPDVSKIPDTVLKASINKMYEISPKNKFEADFDMYETIVELIKANKIQLEPIERFVQNCELSKEAKKDKNLSKVFAQEQIENGEITEDELSGIETIVGMMKGKLKEEETKKYNKEIGKETKDKDLSKEKSIDMEALAALIVELGLEDKIKIEE